MVVLSSRGNASDHPQTRRSNASPRFAFSSPPPDFGFRIPKTFAELFKNDVRCFVGFSVEGS
jgi:hypothetical protein